MKEDFSTTTTGMSFYDDSLNYNTYARETKGNFSEVFMMSPDDYIDLCVFGFQSMGSNTDRDKLISDRKRQIDDIEKYKEIIQNETMDMLVLHFTISDAEKGEISGFTQEGIHRAIAAKELGIDEVPVLVMFSGRKGLKALRLFAKGRNYKQLTNNWTDYQWKNDFVDNANELYESDNMKEDLTFFKDDKNQNGSRVKNPNRVFAAKKAHKTHRFNYKQANNGDRLMKDRASMIASTLENYLQEKIEEINPVNLYSEINSNNTTMGVTVQFNKDYSSIDITFGSQDESGHGSYKLESENLNKELASTLFKTLTNDLEKLIVTFDNDFEALLKKNGIVRKFD